MFGFLRQAKPVALKGADAVGCFGKLPIRPDFIKYNVAQREALALDQWIQDGYAYWLRLAGRAPGEGMEGELHYCVFGGTADERTLLATLMPSQDQSGRSYPFVVYRLASAPWLLQRPSAIPVAFAEFFSGAEQLSRHPWRKDAVQAVAAAVDRLRPGSLEDAASAAEAEDRRLSQAPATLLWSLLETAAQGQRARFFHALHESLAQVARRGAQRTHWGMRLPLPQGPDRQPVLVFWLRLIELALGRGKWRASYLWNEPRQGRTAAVTVFFRSMQPSILSQLLGAGERRDLVVDIAREAATVAQPSAAAERVAALAHGSLLDLLRVIDSGRSAA